MPITITNIGEREFLERMFNNPDKCVVRLFKNNVTPTKTDVLSKYIQTSAQGYSPKVLDGNWSFAMNNGSFEIY
jgi:hypothetical protein